MADAVHVDTHLVDIDHIRAPYTLEDPLLLRPQPAGHRLVTSSTVAGVTDKPYVLSRASETFLWGSLSPYLISVAWTRAFFLSQPVGGQSGCLAVVWLPQLGHS